MGISEANRQQLLQLKEESALVAGKEVRLKEYVKGKPSAAFLQSEIHTYMASPEYAEALQGEAYFNAKTDIDKKERYIIGNNGQPIVDKGILSNTKLRHNFFYKMVRQKVDYLLAKPFTIKLPPEQAQLAQLLELQYFTPSLRQSIKRATYNAIKQGVSWLQVYVDDDGSIKFKRVKAQNIKVYWEDEEHTQIAAVIKFFIQIQVGVDGNSKEVKKVEFYNKSGVYYFIEDDKGLVKDTTRGNEEGWAPYYYYKEQIKDLNEATGEMEPRMITDEQGNQIPVMSEPIAGNFGIVPFIPIKYNDDEIPLLRFIKDKIDDYDVITSTTSDTIKDVPSSIKIVKGYTGTDGASFTKNLAERRTVFVAKDGGVEALETKQDILTIDSHLDRLREDIYADGSGVDPTKTEGLGNQSGIALRYVYQDLDGDVQEIWSSVDLALKQIYQFICIDMEQKGYGAWYNEPIEFIANTDALINETETINNLVSSMAMLSRRTIIANHPYVTNVEQEYADKEQESLAEMQRYVNTGDGFGSHEHEEENQEDNQFNQDY